MTAGIIKIVLSEALNALRKIRDNPQKLILASLADIFFFVAYGFITMPLFNKIVDYIIAIGTIVSEKSPQIVRGTNPGISSVIMSDPQASQMLNNVIMLFILVAVAIYVLYTFFQGICWKLSSDIAGRKILLHNYMKKFAVLNIFWMGLFIIQHLFSLYTDLKAYAMHAVPEEGVQISIGALILLFAIFYFAFISYALIGTSREGIKNSFKTGINKIGYILSAHVLIAAVYFVLQKLLGAVASVDVNLMVIAGILLVIPAMTWARVYITLVIAKAK